jgi:hypothetical protein
VSDSPTRPPRRRRPSRSTTAGARRRTRAATPAPAADATRRVPAVAARFAIKPDLELGLVWEHVFPTPPSEFRVQVRRPDDLLVFDLVFDNLQLAPDAPPRLVRKSATPAPTITVEFPPQSFAEQAFLEGAPEVADAEHEAVPPLPSAKARMAGPSRVAIAMPADVESLDFTLAAVLEALRTWPMRLALTALPDPVTRVDAGFNRNWLAAVTASGEWKAARALFQSALVPQGAEGLDEAVAQAGARLAEFTAAGLERGEIEVLPAELRRLMQREVEQLVARFPAIGRGAARDVATASLALSATEALAGISLKHDFSLELVEAIPFLPILLAPHEPSKKVTALELPYRLLLSPIMPARWLHADEPVERGGRVELWHTRLRTAPTEAGPDGSGKVRAIWSPDYPLNAGLFVEPPKPFRMSLHALDRQWLVKLMAGFNEVTATGHAYHPRTGREHRLHLSALGGLLDVDGHWTSRPDGVDLEQWRHLAGLGRDAYVRVVYVGALCPFGHAAALVKVTERKFESLGSGRVAVLRQRFFIVVRERVREYLGASHEFKGHNFPFTSVEILTRVTPNLIVPGVGPSALQATPSVYDSQIVPQMVFWPMVTAARDVSFEMAATDLSGRRVTFSMPLLFISETANNKKPAAIKAGYNASGTVARRRAQTANATVCYAPFTPADKGDPRLPTESLTFAAGNLTTPLPARAQLLPGGGSRACRHPRRAAPARAAERRGRRDVSGRLQAAPVWGSRSDQEHGPAVPAAHQRRPQSRLRRRRRRGQERRAWRPRHAADGDSGTVARDGSGRGRGAGQPR